jgi:tetratricopeptide (TPR) repeat protein
VRRLGEALGDRRLQSNAAWNTGRVLITQREYEAAIAAGQHALTLTTDPQNTHNILYTLGRAYLENGDAAQAIPLLTQAAQLCAQMQNRAQQGLILAYLGRAYLMCGDVEQAQDLARQGYTLATAAQYKSGIGVALMMLGRIALARGAVAEAETSFQEARQLYTTMRGRYGLGLVYLDLARLAHAQSNSEAVITHLHEAQTLFSALHLPKWVEHITQLAHELGVSLAVP